MKRTLNLAVIWIAAAIASGCQYMTLGAALAYDSHRDGKKFEAYEGFPPDKLKVVKENKLHAIHVYGRGKKRLSVDAMKARNFWVAWNGRGVGVRHRWVLKRFLFDEKGRLIRTDEKKGGPQEPPVKLFSP